MSYLKKWSVHQFWLIGHKPTDKQKYFDWVNTLVFFIALLNPHFFTFFFNPVKKYACLYFFWSKLFQSILLNETNENEKEDLSFQMFIIVLSASSNQPSGNQIISQQFSFIFSQGVCFLEKKTYFSSSPSPLIKTIFPYVKVICLGFIGRIGKTKWCTLR